MNILPVTAPEFAAYGRLVPDFAPECAALARALLEHTPLPAQLGYVPREPGLQDLPAAYAAGARSFVSGSAVFTGAVDRSVQALRRAVQGV